MPVAIALGSNLGDRRKHLESGVRMLTGFVEGLRVSRIYESAAVGLEEQPPFLNACCTGFTRLTPRDLLSRLLESERAAGRVRGGARFGPRVLDLDLLLYGDKVVESSDLTVPHARMRERGFVMLPLSEIAGSWIVPASQGSPERTVAQLLEELSTTGVCHLSAVGSISEDS